MSEERTEGYVIRSLANPGEYRYQTMHDGARWSHSVNEAEVMSLGVASRFLRGGGYSNAEIVRVRRVKGEEGWERLPLGTYRIGPVAPENWPPTTYENSDERQGFTIERLAPVPDAPRWEIVE